MKCDWCGSEGATLIDPKDGRYGCDSDDPRKMLGCVEAAHAD